MFGGWVIASIAALGPDIDSKGSVVSQLFGYPSKFASFGIRKAFGGHRKITHSILGLLIIAILLYFASLIGLPYWVALAIGVGWTSHIVADSCTTMGCPWLWPIDHHNYGLPLVKTGSEIEMKGVVPIAGILTALFSLMMVVGK